MTTATATTTQVDERRLGRDALIVIALLVLAQFLNHVDRGNLAIAAPLIKDELKLDASHFGMLLSAWGWTYVIATPLAGLLAERLGAYRVMAVGLGLWGLATLATGFAGSFGAILALRMALGLGESVCTPCTSKLISEHAPPGRLGAANSAISQGLAMGPAFGAFFGGMLMAGFGWRPLFLIFGGLSVAWLIPWMLATRKLHTATSEGSARGPAPTFREILSRRELWGMAIAQLSGAYGFYFMVSWLPLYLVKARGFSLTQMGTILGSVYLVFAASAATGGWLTDRWIARGASQGQARKTAATLAHLLSATGLLVTAFAPRDQVLVGLFLGAIGQGIVNPHTFATPQVLAGRNATAKWLGVQNCLGNLSSIVGPLITGAIIDRTGGFQGAFVVTAGVLVFGLVGWLGLIPRVEPIAWKTATARS